MKAIWGFGLESKWYLGGRLGLRRNTKVYDVILEVANIRIILTIRRKK